MFHPYFVVKHGPCGWPVNCLYVLAVRRPNGTIQTFPRTATTSRDGALALARKQNAWYVETFV